MMLMLSLLIDGSKTTMILRFDPHAKVMKSQTLELFQAGNGTGVDWMEYDRAFGRTKRWMLLFPLEPQTVPSSQIPGIPLATATAAGSS